MKSDVRRAMLSSVYVEQCHFFELQDAAVDILPVAPEDEQKKKQLDPQIISDLGRKAKKYTVLENNLGQENRQEAQGIQGMEI